MIATAMQPPATCSSVRSYAKHRQIGAKTFHRRGARCALTAVSPTLPSPNLLDEGRIKTLSDMLVNAEQPGPVRTGSTCPADDSFAVFGNVCHSFFYKETLDPEGLKDSLSKTLGPLDVFAGRIILEGGKKKLVSNNEGLSFRTSSLDLCLDELVPGAELYVCGGQIFQPDLNLLIDHIPDEVSVDKPVLYIHLVQLSGGGSILLVVGHHGIYDNTTFITFMEALSKIDGGGSVPPVLFGSEAYAVVVEHHKPDQNSDFKHFLQPIPKEGAGPPPPLPLLDMATFFVSAKRVKELKQEASKSLPPGTEFISSNDAVAARMTQIVGTLPSRGADGAFPPIINLFPVYVRGRLTDPRDPSQLLLTPTHVGNHVLASLSSPICPATASLGKIAASLRSAINSSAMGALDEYKMMHDLADTHLFVPTISPHNVYASTGFSQWDWSQETLALQGQAPVHYLGWMPNPPLRNCFMVHQSFANNQPGLLLTAYSTPELVKEIKEHWVDF
eukprot:gene24850-10508_t